MKERSSGFLAPIFDEPKPFPEVAEYLTEVHGLLWRFVRTEFPGASGRLNDYVELALQQAERRNIKKENKNARKKISSEDAGDHDGFHSVLPASDSDNSVFPKNESSAGGIA